MKTSRSFLSISSWIRITLVICWCITSYYKFSGLKSCTFINSVSVSRVWAQFNWFPCFRVPHKAAIQLPVGAVVSCESSRREGATSKLFQVVGKIQFPEDYWTVCLIFLMAVGWKLPLVLCHVDLSNIAPWLIKVCKPRKQGESVSKTDIIIILQVTSPSSLLYLNGSPILKQRGLHRTCEYQGMGIIGKHLESAHHKDVVPAWGNHNAILL